MRRSDASTVAARDLASVGRRRGVTAETGNNGSFVSLSKNHLTSWPRFGIKYLSWKSVARGRSAPGHFYFPPIFAGRNSWKLHAPVTRTRPVGRALPRQTIARHSAIAVASATASGNITTASDGCRVSRSGAKLPESR